MDGTQRSKSNCIKAQEKPAKSGQNRKMVKILPKLVVESGQNDVLLKFHTLKP